MFDDLENGFIIKVQMIYPHNIDLKILWSIFKIHIYNTYLITFFIFVHIASVATMSFLKDVTTRSRDTKHYQRTNSKKLNQDSNSVYTSYNDSVEITPTLIEVTTINKIKHKTALEENLKMSNTVISHKIQSNKYF